MTLGEKIQELRTSRHMSQEQFGELMETTRQTVSKWELDQAVPEVRKIVALSRYFCISTDELLLNVSTFEKEGVPFTCGVYRKGCLEIVETEKVALEYYAKGKTAMGAKAWLGNGDQKKLFAICEKDCETGKITYAYRYEDAAEDGAVISNDEGCRRQLGAHFERDRLDRMERLETFLVNHGEYPLHTVKELGIRRCLEEWRRGVGLYASAECFQISLCTGKLEYIYSIRPEFDNVYCGCSFVVPFDLGLRSYGQYFRLRNYKDNSEGYCQSHYDFDYRMPVEPEGINCVKLACNTIGSGDENCWFVKRYQQDEIVLDGCGRDEYVYRKKDEKYERFEAKDQ